MSVNTAHTNEAGGAVAVSQSVADNGLYRAVDSLPEEMRDMRMELRYLGDEN